MEVKDAQYISFFPKNEKTSPISYTGYSRYIESWRNDDGTVINAPVGEDFKITCNQNFKDIELNEKYSINFYGGFRHLSTDFLDQIAHLVVGIAFILKWIKSEEQDTAGIDHADATGINQFIKERIFVFRFYAWLYNNWVLSDTLYLLFDIVQLSNYSFMTKMD